MFTHTEVYCGAEEGIQRLASIKAHNKSHVPLLLTARVPHSAQLWGCYKVERVRLKSAFVQLVHSTQHCLLLHSWLPLQKSSELPVKCEKKFGRQEGADFDSHYLILSQRLAGER